jgi:hypothetical protein
MLLMCSKPLQTRPSNLFYTLGPHMQTAHNALLHRMAGGDWMAQSIPVFRLCLLAYAGHHSRPSRLQNTTGKRKRYPEVKHNREDQPRPQQQKRQMDIGTVKHEGITNTAKKCSTTKVNRGAAVENICTHNAAFNY